jgi:hypothetical protein
VLVLDLAARSGSSIGNTDNTGANLVAVNYSWPTADEVFQ